MSLKERSKLMAKAYLRRLDQAAKRIGTTTKALRDYTRRTRMTGR